MRKALIVCAMFSTLSGLGLAETWSGTLLDANCSHRHSTTKSCDAKRSSTTFLLDSNGTRYKLDAKSDDEVRSAIQERTGKSAPVAARITGRMRSSGKIHAQIVEIQ
jgi:hypothetical protein